MTDEKYKLLQRRIEAAEKSMVERGINTLLIVNDNNKKYLSDFDSTSYTLIISSDENYIVTDFRYIEAAQDLEPLYKAEETEPGHSLFDFLKELAEKNGDMKLGIESTTVTLDFYEKLRKTLRGKKLYKSDGLIENIRTVKDKEELSNIARAEKIGDEAFSYILGVIRPGLTEKEIALRLELKMRELGAEGLSFETICVSGARTSMPHGRPSDKKIENGDFVTLDFGCTFNGYCSDMTRTVGVGSVSDEQKKIYDIVLRAQTTACEGIHAGMTGRQADALARDIIAAEGYAECFGHGMGHGVGLEIHESPTANPSSLDIFRSGMLITIEPGIYLPEKFGVRIEDLSIVRDSDIIILSESRKELIIL